MHENDLGVSLWVDISKLASMFVPGHRGKPMTCGGLELGLDLKTTSHENNTNTIKKTYRPGDAFGFIVENDQKEVKRFLNVVSVDGDSILILKLDKDNVYISGTAPVAQLRV